MTKQTIYTVGGTVQAGGGVYIKRKVDDELLGLCRNGEFAFILSSRQVGKSSLMVRTAQELEADQIRSVIIDLSALGTNVTPDEWYLGILNEIYTTLNLNMDIFDWWGQYDWLGPAQRMTNFFKDVLLKEVNEKIVLFFDEIDSTLSIPFSDDFYIALRAIYNARSITPDFKRLSFVLVGVAAPGDLISDSKRTPFNIGRRVDVTDFTLEEAKPLVQVWGDKAEEISKWVFRYTSGHPYLTQRLCAYLASLKETPTEQGVADAVDKLFFGENGKQDNNLQFVRDMLARRSRDATRVLLVYRDIRSGKRILDDERSVEKAHLKLSGLVCSEQGMLKVRNQIYNSVFTARWTNENIPKNWAKVAAFSLSLVTFMLLSLFVYDYAVSIRNEQYRSHIYGSGPSGQLETLGKIFNLQGVFANSDYDASAREVFFSLKASEQEAIFNYSSPETKRMYLFPVVKGLYISLANIEGGQDSTPLLQIMKRSLERGDLFDEINYWILARQATTEKNALDNYSAAIQVNGDNPSTHYERAVVEIKMGAFVQALEDLEATMSLAKNLSIEGAEDKLPTSTLLPTFTVVPPIIDETVTEPASPTVIVTSITSPQVSETSLPIPQSESPDQFASQLPNENSISHPPDVETYMPLKESYRSSFYSTVYIRSAIDMLIQKSLDIPEFRVALIETWTDANKFPELSKNNLFPNALATPQLSKTAIITAISSASSTTHLNAQSTATITRPLPTITDTSTGPLLEINSQGAAMILVPAGNFQMGAISGDLRALSDEYPLHEVQMDAYYIDKYEVTNVLYKICVDAGVCKPPVQKDSKVQRKYYGNPIYDQFPVVYVNWDMAQAYCEWRGASLPTEAQWEKAARGIEPRLYPWEGTDLSCQLANYNERCVYGTNRVGIYEKGKSLYGVYDMAGNVWEWVKDWYSQDYYRISFPTNPTGPVYGQAKVFRGGSWASSEDDIRTSKRIRYPSGYSNFDLGFRCAMSVP